MLVRNVSGIVRRIEGVSSLQSGLAKTLVLKFPTLQRFNRSTFYKPTRQYSKNSCLHFFTSSTKSSSRYRYCAHCVAGWTWGKPQLCCKEQHQRCRISWCEDIQIHAHTSLQSLKEISASTQASTHQHTKIPSTPTSHQDISTSTYRHSTMKPTHNTARPCGSRFE
jgi:hypothetical protein